VTFDRGAWTEVPWNITFGTEEIVFDDLVTPAELFSRNSALIAGNRGSADPIQRDLELLEGRYIVTINQGNTVKVLTFDPKTGVLIPEQ
jgi:hypothetical protein